MTAWRIQTASAWRLTGKITKPAMSNKEKPIPFSTPEVKAILSGAKTKMRRIIKPQPVLDQSKPGLLFWNPKGKLKWGKDLHICGEEELRPPAFLDHAPYKKGNVLYVRETFASYFDDGQVKYLYKADPMFDSSEPGDIDWDWKPSIHMPREAARIFLRVKDVRVERLRDITVQEVCRELGKEYKPSGKMLADFHMHDILFDDFKNHWGTMHAKSGYGWDSNPWVWVISFERIDKPELGQ
jgi:hypothetical protein